MVLISSLGKLGLHCMIMTFPYNAFFDFLYVTCITISLLSIFILLLYDTVWKVSVCFIYFFIFTLHCIIKRYFYTNELHKQMRSIMYATYCRLLLIRTDPAVLHAKVLPC